MVYLQVVPVQNCFVKCSHFSSFFTIVIKPNSVCRVCSSCCRRRCSGCCFMVLFLAAEGYLLYQVICSGKRKPTIHTVELVELACT
jgi:hypothetical protein